ncbi:MAG TPA: transcriptional regulator [Thermoplasmata archaeon]|nr:transcriptional regulator [Thermoplasmata archaeon]
MILMKKEELLNTTRILLEKAGFYCSEVCRVRPSGFDFIARKDNQLFVIKILNNIDALASDVANEMIAVAKFLEGIPIVIGNKTCSSLLEDGVVYFRYGVPIITPPTLEDYLRGMSPFICAAPGGFYVNIDGNLLKKIRGEKGISVGQLARVVGVSRRTIRLYEQGERASIEMAERITEFLEADIIKPVDFWEETRKEKIEIERKIDDEIFRILEEMGAFILPTQRSPFNAMTKIINEKFIVGMKERKIVEKARIISNLARVAEKESVIFMDKSFRKNIEGVPIVIKEELLKMREPEEIVSLILERK